MGYFIAPPLAIEHLCRHTLCHTFCSIPFRFSSALLISPLILPTTITPTCKLGRNISTLLFSILSAKNHAHILHILTDIHARRGSLTSHLFREVLVSHSPNHVYCLHILTCLPPFLAPFSFPRVCEYVYLYVCVCVWCV